MMLQRSLVLLPFLWLATATASSSSSTTTETSLCTGTWRRRETHHSSSNVMVAENNATLWVFPPKYRGEEDPVNRVLKYRTRPHLPSWKYEFSCQNMPKLALSHTEGDIWALGCPSQQARLYNGQALTSKAGSVTLFQWNHTRHRARIVQTIFGKNTTDQMGSSIAMSANGQTIALVASSMDAKEKRTNPTSSYLQVYRYDGVETNKWQPLGDSIAGITKVAISNAGDRVAAMTTNRLLQVYSYTTAGVWQEEAFPTRVVRAESVSSMALSGNGQVLSLLQHAKGRPTLQLYRRHNKHRRWILDSSIPQTGSSAFGWVASLSADGSRIALAEPSYQRGAGAVYVYDYQPKTEQWRQVGDTLYGIYPDSLGRHLHLSQDGSHLIVKAMAYTAIYEYHAPPSKGCEDGNKKKNKQNLPNRDEL